MPAAPVTPAGVRDGDPAALIGLCAVRGPSVVAYCRHMVGDADAAEAAADAFARFRAAVVAAGDLSQLNPEPLLISATRKATAHRAGRAAQGVCAELPALLAARADKAISIADAARLDQHIESCWACRAPVARFKAAERAYRDPPEPTIDPAIAAQIFVALSTAAPARAAAAPAPPASASSNGAGGLPLVETGELEPVETLDQPTTEFHTPDVLDPDPVAAQVAVVSEPATPAKTGLVGSLLGSFGLGPSRADLRLPPRVDEPEPEAEIVLEGKPVRERARERAAERAAAGTAIGSRLPRPRRGAEPTSPPPRERARGDRRRRGGRLPLVLPIVVILIALVVALFVSGVFGGSDPASSPRISVPADVPSDAGPADVVVVPGAKQASADAVEVAKARERARARRKREAAVARVTTKTTPATTPPAAATPPATVTPPPPRPPPPPASANANGTTTKKSSGSRKIEAGSGATGAEQIPPAQDTSTVPDLAPPPETATKP